MDATAWSVPGAEVATLDQLCLGVNLCLPIGLVPYSYGLGFTPRPRRRCRFARRRTLVKRGIVVLFLENQTCFSSHPRKWADLRY
jgi:hypothetical protein